MKRGSICCFLLLIAFVASGTQCPTGMMPIGSLTGNALNGKLLFTINACIACHCIDASGGCAANAPALRGVATQELDDRLRGSKVHPGGKFSLTDQEIADLQAFLADPSI